MALTNTPETAADAKPATSVLPEPFIGELEPFLVYSRIDILANLRVLIDQHVLATVYYDHGASFIVTRFLALNPEFEELIFDLGPDGRNNEKLLAELAGQSDRRAHFACVLVLVRSAEDPQPIIAEGEWHGTILDAQRGADGFGYDPLFYVPTHCQTAAELDGAIKNKLSHRGQAMQKLITRLPAL